MQNYSACNVQQRAKALSVKYKGPYMSAQSYMSTIKFQKFSDARNLCCNHPKTGKKRFCHQEMHPKDADNIANREDPDQTAPLGAV